MGCCGRKEDNRDKPITMGHNINEDNKKGLQNTGSSFNITHEKGIKPTSYNGNAYCAKCKQLWLGVSIPKFHTCTGNKQNEIFSEERLFICKECPLNEVGICKSEKIEDKDKKIEVKKEVTYLRSKCPEGKWLPIEYICKKCGFVNRHSRGVTDCKNCAINIGKRLNIKNPRGAPKKGRKWQPLSQEELDRLRKGTGQHLTKNTIKKSEDHGFFLHSLVSGPFSYVDGYVPEFINLAKFSEDIGRLASKIPPETDTIVGVARSGLFVSTMLSMMLHKPQLIIRQTLNDVIEGGNGWRLGASKHVTAELRNIVVIDDTVMTGNSIKQVKPILGNVENIKFASVYLNPRARVRPDIFVKYLGWPHLLEWNLFNSVLSPNMAVDFDGILCYDCQPHQDDDGKEYLNFIENAIPKYLPRRTPIPLIVTARIEKYRKPTEEWLNRHQIKYSRLVMHPAKTLRERRKDDIARFKADHYRAWAKTFTPKPPPYLFIESDDRQARMISEYSGKFVVCPSSSKCYGY